MKKSACLIVIVLLATVKFSLAQSEYKSAVGGRVGIPIAASFKHFIFDKGAIEAYAGFRNATGIYYSGINFTMGVMYQHHFPIGSVEGLQWYVGGGALVQFYSYNSRNNPLGYSNTGLGINGVGGVDYKFSSIPLNVSADWMPTFFLNKTYYDNFGAGYGGIAARYTFR